MNSIPNQTQTPRGLTLVLGGTGKTGQRIVDALEAKGVPTRIGSRSAFPAFDWHHAAGWDACLQDVEAVYINYAPDLAMPGATDAIQALVDKANRHGVKRLVLLSGRGETEAQACERIVQDSGVDWTIVRASWFNQNFSEGAFLDMVMAGQITLPAGDTPEPFVDVDDIAEVAVAALTEPGHAGEVYEVTGPSLMTFADIATELSKATGREIVYVPVPHEAFVTGVKESGAPKEVVWMLDYLFNTVLDGRNAHLTDGIQRALGRPPKDFAEYAKGVAATGLWRGVALTV
ncbi:MAG: NAD(P)H-binding protein [Cyanobacteria bacterium P01_E01_bin.6]